MGAATLILAAASWLPLSSIVRLSLILLAFLLFPIVILDQVYWRFLGRRGSQGNPDLE